MKYKMKLIAPSSKRFTNRESSKFHFPPLALALLAAHTPENFEIQIIDEAAENLILDHADDVDIVGISAFTPTANRGYEIADFYRKNNVPVVMGGLHVSALPEEALQHADAVVIGEGDIVWGNLLEDFIQNKMSGIYKPDKYYDLAQMPFSRLDLYPKNANYLIKPNIHVTRGCPHNCSFCSVTKFWGRKIRKRPVEAVIAELKHIKKNYDDGSGRFVFNDDNFFANKKYTKELFRQMIPLKMKWQAFAGIDIAEDDELLQLCKDAGALGLYVGFDAINKKDLQGTNKKVNTKYDYIEWVKKIQEGYGIPVIAGLVVGFDHDSVDSFKKINDFLYESMVSSLSINILYPYPGTPIFHQLNNEKRITSYDWDNYVMDGINYIPATMTQDELHDGYLEVVRRFCTDESIERRAAYASTTPMGKLGSEMIRTWGVGVQRQYNELLQGENKIRRPTS